MRQLQRQFLVLEDILQETCEMFRDYQFCEAESSNPGTVPQAVRSSPLSFVPLTEA